MSGNVAFSTPAWRGEGGEEDVRSYAGEGTVDSGGREGEGQSTYRVFHLDALVPVGDLLELRQHDLEVLVGQLVVLAVAELRGRGLVGMLLDVGRAGVLGVGKYAFALRTRRGEESGSSCGGDEGCPGWAREDSSTGKPDRAAGGGGG